MGGSVPRLRAQERASITCAGACRVCVCGGVSVSAVVDEHEVRVVSIYLFHVIIIVILCICLCIYMQ